jgi:pyruvate dehydrogenase E1 component alpha subunit
MPSHQSARAVNVVSWSSCIGTQLPHAVGMALAARKTGRSDIALGFLGDGATSHPDFHAALNLAGVFRAPCVFVCQNNQFAISVGIERQTANPRLFEKAFAYGIAGQRVDGNDAEAVLHAIAEAAERAREGGGPSFIECFTYRVAPHSSSDEPSLYRDEALTRSWEARDPIALLRARLLAAGELELAMDEELTSAFSRELDVAVELAESAGPPPLASLFDDVYERLPAHLAEQAALLVKGTRPT